jgi:hypothetical protein
VRTSGAFRRGVAGRASGTAPSPLFGVGALIFSDSASLIVKEGRRRSIRPIAETPQLPKVVDRNVPALGAVAKAILRFRQLPERQFEIPCELGMSAPPEPLRDEGCRGADCPADLSAVLVILSDRRGAEDAVDPRPYLIEQLPADKFLMGARPCHTDEPASAMPPIAAQNRQSSRAFLQTQLYSTQFPNGRRRITVA